MIKSNITEVIGLGIERKIYCEWKHEGGVLGCSSSHINFEVDGKEYVLTLYEVGDGKHFTDYLVADDSLTDEIKADGGRMSGWISVKDGLPEKKGWYIVSLDYGDGRFFVWGSCYFNGEKFDPAEGHRVTHWMPLPEPPKEEEDVG